MKVKDFKDSVKTAFNGDLSPLWAGAGYTGLGFDAYRIRYGSSFHSDGGAYVNDIGVDFYIRESSIIRPRCIGFLTDLDNETSWSTIKSWLLTAILTNEFG